MKANASISFTGSYVLGLGFTMTPDRARELIERDPGNRDVLFPYINAADLCDRSDISPSRWIVNFHDWSEHTALRYTDCFAIVDSKVRPERQRRNLAGDYVLRKPLPDRWWQYADKRPALYRAIAQRATVITMPLVSKFSMPMLLPTGYVYAHLLAVFASESDALYGVISSQIHRAWARIRGSTLETRARYTPTDCFETFALPDDGADTIGAIMRTLHERRTALMLSSGSGVTATYNRVHAPSEAEAEVLVLRELHRKLDDAVLAAYGWQDVDLDHDFRETDEGLRFTISDAARVEILDRLLELNHERHAAEVASCALDVPRRKNGSSRRRKDADVAPVLLELR